MERIAIIGCGGSGKSTLARELGRKTGLPVVHLDRIFWSPGNWQHLSREEFDALLITEVDQPHWILDGNYDRTMEVRLQRCDTVIYLDYNEWLDPEFFRWLWNFNRQYRKKYHQILSQLEGKEVYIFRNRRQLKKFLESI